MHGLLREGPFRYQQRADLFLEAALRLTAVPVKQAVISTALAARELGVA